MKRTQVAIGAAVIVACVAALVWWLPRRAAEPVAERADEAVLKADASVAVVSDGGGAE